MRLSPFPHRPVTADRRLAVIGLGLLLVGAVMTLVELVVLRRVTAPVLALDSIGGSLLPVGLLSLFMAGRIRRALGLEIDWQRFEREFYAYARAVSRS
jgi:hypothetical protein